MSRRPNLNPEDAYNEYGRLLMENGSASEETVQQRLAENRAAGQRNANALRGRIRNALNKSSRQKKRGNAGGASNNALLNAAKAEVNLEIQVKELEKQREIEAKKLEKRREIEASLQAKRLELDQALRLKEGLQEFLQTCQTLQVILLSSPNTERRLGIKVIVAFHDKSPYKQHLNLIKQRMDTIFSATLTLSNFVELCQSANIPGGKLVFLSYVERSLAFETKLQNGEALISSDVDSWLVLLKGLQAFIKDIDIKIIQKIINENGRFLNVDSLKIISDLLRGLPKNITVETAAAGGSAAAGGATGGGKSRKQKRKRSRRGTRKA